MQLKSNSLTQNFLRVDQNRGLEALQWTSGTLSSRYYDNDAITIMRTASLEARLQVAHRGRCSCAISAPTTFTCTSHPRDSIIQI